MATTLYGYGPHTLAAGTDYDIACAPRPGRASRLTIAIDISAGDITVKSRGRGSTADYATQSYTKSDETLAAAAVAADATIKVDNTGKDIRLTTAALTVASVLFSVDSDS